MIEYAWRILFSEKCECAGVKNEYNHGGYCNYHVGYDDGYKNGLWCYAESTACREAKIREEEFRSFLNPRWYTIKGYYGPSRSACRNLHGT